MDDEILIEVLGEVTVHGPGRIQTVRGRQPRAVLTALALENRPVSRDELAHLLWGDRLTDHWQGALRGVLSKVRTALVAAGLDQGAVQVEAGTARLDPSIAVSTDLSAVEQDIEAAEALHRGGDHQRAVELCASSCETLDQPFLPHDESDWSRRWRQHIDELAARAAHLEVAALSSAGRFEAAASRARRRIAVDSLDETAHHQLVEALLTGRNRAQAIEAHEELKRILESELGISPAAATTALLDDIHGEEPTAEQPRPPATPARQPMPRTRRSFHPHEQDPFVGRDAELTVLAACWERVAGTLCPELVVIEGPTGMGKTRLAGRFAAETASKGNRVMWGRGRSGIDLAYGPWVEALEAALDDDPAVVDVLGPRAAPLAAVLPHLSGPLEDFELPGDASVARTQLFSAMAATVTALADDPTLLVIDDLQWATEDSLALLEAVLDGLERPLLVVVTTRTGHEEVQRCLMSIQRLVRLTTLQLEGLTVHEVTDLVEDAAMAELLHSRTGGLPFFVAEMARSARASGQASAADDLPDATRSWVHRRFATLPPELAELLTMVVVVGTPVDLDLLVRLSGSDAATVVSRTDELMTLGLLSDAAEDGTVEPAHAITAEVIYDSLGGTRRARLHRLVAEALEEDPATSDAHGALAHHWARAGRPGRATAARHSRLAGQAALDRGAWELAATAFDRAVELADDPAGDPVELARALIGSGLAHHAQGSFEQAVRLLDGALEVSRAHGLGEEQAEATLALVGRAGRGAAVADDGEQIRLLREAIAAMEPKIGEGSSTGHHRREALACALDRELAIALLLTDAVEERTKLAERALARARSLVPPEPAATAAALLGRRLVNFGPHDLAERLADLDEVLTLPRNRLNPEVALSAHCYRHEDLVRAGRHEAAGRALDRAEVLAERQRDPYWQWAVTTWKGLRANIEGDIELAADLAHRAHASRSGIPEAGACLGVNLVNIALFEGRAGEVLDLIGGAATTSEHIPAYRAVLALCAAEAGELGLAEASYHHFERVGFANLPMDTNRFLGLAVLADVAVHLGDADGGRLLTGLLDPYRGQWVLVNCYGGGGGHWGPVAHQLARLAVLDGRHADAEQLFDEAMAASIHAPLVAARVAGDRARTGCS